MKTPCEDSPFAYRPGLCTSKRRCTLGEVPITQEIRANKAWGSGAESPGGNPYGPDRELFLCFLLLGLLMITVSIGALQASSTGSIPVESTNL